jgi:hypothetical protein
VDYFRLPKRGWYWYRNALRGIAPPTWPQPGVAAALRLSASSLTIEHADGTDDVQVVVTVVDAKGTPLSNSPDVKLTVESGPGGFPTGRSILFRSGTDIPILDGQSAIEFRSYYSGMTTIRASSPGLADAVITVASNGAPPYVAGSTPEFLPAPYVRFVGTHAGVETEANITLDRPTNASSMAAEHQSKLAADGDAATYWLPDAAAVGPQWWESDLEGVWELSSVQVRFAGVGSCGYEVQLSTDDRMSWKKVVAGSAEMNGAPVRMGLPAGAKSSGLRLVLTPQTQTTVCGLAEVAVQGARAR